jgi:hypothetical protein
VARAAQARRRSLSLGRRRSTRACFVRARCRAGCDRFMSRRKVLHRREGSLFWCAAVVRRASCGLQLQASAACLARRRRVGARCLSGGDAVLELSSRARSAAMVVVGPYPAKGRCAGETSLPFGARPFCDVPAAASNFKPAPRGSCGAGAAALAVSGEETQHSSLLCVRVVPRWLWPELTLPTDAVTARYSSPSARGRGATCELWPPTSSQRRVAFAAQARRCSLSLGRRRSTRACFACA